MFQNVLTFVLMFSWVGVIPSGVPPSSDRRMTNIAIENGHRNSGFTQLENGDFP